MSVLLNRHRELYLLHERYRDEGAEPVVLYGRRRVGKSELMNQFLALGRGIRLLAREESKTLVNGTLFFPDCGRINFTTLQGGSSWCPMEDDGRDAGSFHPCLFQCGLGDRPGCSKPSAEIPDPLVRKREISGLIEAMENYRLDNGLILTMDGEEPELIMDEKKTEIIPVWKWILS